jgi:hypothetical protein
MVVHIKSNKNIYNGPWFVYSLNYVQALASDNEIDKRGTLKATEHDKYENIACWSFTR